MTYFERFYVGWFEYVVLEFDVIDFVVGREERCLDSEYVFWILFGVVYVDEVVWISVINVNNNKYIILN